MNVRYPLLASNVAVACFGFSVWTVIVYPSGSLKAKNLPNGPSAGGRRMDNPYTTSSARSSSASVAAIQRDTPHPSLLVASRSAIGVRIANGTGLVLKTTAPGGL